jgi:hypothetical protein
MSDLPKDFGKSGEQKNGRLWLNPLDLGQHEGHGRGSALDRHQSPQPGGLPPNGLLGRLAVDARRHERVADIRLRRGSISFAETVIGLHMFRSAKTVLIAL